MCIVHFDCKTYRQFKNQVIWIMNRYHQWFISSTPLMHIKNITIDSGPSNIIRTGVWKDFWPNKNGQNRAFHKATELSRWRSPPQGSDNIKDAPINHTKRGWEDCPEVTNTLQWWRQPEEANQINIEWSDEKNTNKTNKPNRVTEHNLIQTNPVHWTPPTSHAE